MYYEYFGLTQAPFKITPNTDFFFTGGNRGPVLEALIYAITHGEGIVKVSGEVGSGKTMLCNMLQSHLPDNVESVYLANPSVAPDEVLHAIAFELQLQKMFNLDHTLQQWERGYVEAALAITQGNLTRAAKLLGIHRTTLYSRMQNYADGTEAVK